MELGKGDSFRRPAWQLDREQRQQLERVLCRRSFPLLARFFASQWFLKRWIWPMKLANNNFQFGNRCDVWPVWGFRRRHLNTGPFRQVEITIESTGLGLRSVFGYAMVIFGGLSRSDRNCAEIRSRCADTVIFKQGCRGFPRAWIVRRINWFWIWATCGLLGVERIASNEQGMQIAKSLFQGHWRQTHAATWGVASLPWLRSGNAPA